MNDEYRQLEAKQAEIAERMKAIKDGEKHTHVAEVLKLMKEKGLTIKDLSQSVPPIWRNAETGDTWAGRGRKPVWFDAAEANGTLEDLRQVG